VIYGVIALLVIVIIIQLVYADRLDERRRKYADELCERWITERDAWHIERQQLLDRIQSPSFAEYKTQEVRVIKAQNNEKEPPKLEVL
jgi:hypothetical protein